MPELHLQRTDNTLTITLGDYTDTIPFTDIALTEEKIKGLYRDAASYGRALFDQTFRTEAIRNTLASLRANERLLLVAEDALVASIPWEYLRDQNGKLLASRLTFVRGLPQTQRREDFTFSGALEIVALPVSPVDVQPVLDVEGEWKNLVKAVSTSQPPKALTAKRVRPPTRSQLERSLNRRSTSIVHFMGHSTSSGDKAFLAFEDARARKHLIDSADFIDSLNERVFLVILNSCLSAVAARTELGNIAQALVQGGIPYALGMQFTIPDNAALVLSQALYGFLLQGHTVEEAVTHMRRALQEPGKLPNAPWLAGVPVLYTSLRTPAPPLELAEGRPTIQPDPERLQQICDLTALPKAEHFVGRSDEISEVLSVLLAPGAHGFVLLHGLGGIGKTSLAQEVARRIGYAYGDRVLAVSFETFSTFDAQHQVVINEQFADNFYNRLARFYGLNPADAERYPTTVALQQAILQQWTHLRTLLVLDNIETLIDAQKRDVSAATSLASFISRLKEGDGAVLLTSRMVPPSDWGDCPTISIGGLGEEAGADLFLALLPADREHLAPEAARLTLSQRVDGHPLSIRLLAGRFADETAVDLATFLEHIEAELEHAEQATPASLEDPARQKTLYACMDYSVRRLTPEQRNVLDAVSLFQAPFLSEFATHLLNDEEQTPLHLQHLLRLGLLSATIKTLQDGELILLELHPMLRWYLQQHLPQRDAALLERYGEVYKNLAHQIYDEYDRSAAVRSLMRQSLADSEAALQYLPPASQSSLAYFLAKLYQRLGQNQRTLALYEQALEISQEWGDVRNIAVIQGAMAYVLVQQGKLPEAIALYEQALRTKQELGEVREAAVTQGAIADVLRQQGKPQEAISLYELALRTFQELGEVREVAAMQHAMADVLVQQGKLPEAIALYEQALRTKQELRDARSIAVTQNGMADVLVQRGKFPEAIALYGQSLRTFQELGDVREVAATQYTMADVLRQQGKLQGAMAFYEQSLRTTQELGDVRSIAVTQNGMADVLRQQGKLQEAMVLYKHALRTKQELGDVREVAVTQNGIANALVDLGKLQEAMMLYEQALHTYQEVGDVRGMAVTQHAMADVLVQQGKPQEAMVLYEQSLRTKQELGDVREVAVTQHVLADMLRQQGKPQEAIALYEQVLHTVRELGDLQAVVVTQANLSQLLLQQGEPRRALVMAWEAYTSLHRSGFSRDAQIMQRSLISIKGQNLGPEQFDTIWSEVIPGPQPEWLAHVQAGSSSRQARISPEQLNVIVANTITVMTEMPEKRAEWREAMEGALKQPQSRNQTPEAEFFAAILAILDGQVPALPKDHAYANELAAISNGIAAGGVQRGSVGVSSEVMQAVRDFVNADDWDASRQVVEAWQELLFRPEVEQFFEQNIEQGRSAGEDRTVELLEMHLALLRACKSVGIAEAFRQLVDEQEEEDLPFDAELVPRSIAALLGGPQQKMEYMGYLNAQFAQASEEGLKALLQVIQLALFSNNDLSQSGRELQGVYRQAWEAIVVRVEADGVDPQIFEQIANNTLAVLGPAASRRSEWRNNLVEVRNGATAHGSRNMTALLDAVIGLLDAGGNPDGLGQGLKGVYARTWQAVVEHLPR